MKQAAPPTAAPGIVLPPVRMRGMLWWIDRWRGSSAFTELTIEEQGAYRNLLDEAWLRGGGIPDDPLLLARASGDPIRWRFLRKKVMKFFELDAHTWRNSTLSEVIRHSQRRADKQRAYRDRMNNTNGNGHGNAAGNKRGNAKRNKAGNERG